MITRRDDPPGRLYHGDTIVKRNHAVQNASLPEEMVLLADYCWIQDGMGVLDVAYGK